MFDELKKRMAAVREEIMAQRGRLEGEDYSLLMLHSMAMFCTLQDHERRAAKEALEASLDVAEVTELFSTWEDCRHV